MPQGNRNLGTNMMIQLGEEVLSVLYRGEGGGGEAVERPQHLHFGQSLQRVNQVGWAGAQVDQAHLAVAPDCGDHGEDFTLDAVVGDTQILVVGKPGEGAGVHVEDHEELVGDDPLVMMGQRGWEERRPSTVPTCVESLLPAQVPAPRVDRVTDQPFVPVRL